MVVLLIILSNLQTKQTIKMAFRIENITHFQNMMIENVQNMEEELFYKQHDEQFDEMEQHIKEKTACIFQNKTDGSGLIVGNSVEILPKQFPAVVNFSLELGRISVRNQSSRDLSLTETVSGTMTRTEKLHRMGVQRKKENAKDLSLTETVCRKIPTFVIQFQFGILFKTRACQQSCRTPNGKDHKLKSRERKKLEEDLSLTETVFPERSRHSPHAVKILSNQRAVDAIVIDLSLTETVCGESNPFEIQGEGDAFGKDSSLTETVCLKIPSSRIQSLLTVNQIHYITSPSKAPASIDSGKESQTDGGVNPQGSDLSNASWWGKETRSQETQQPVLSREPDITHVMSYSNDKDLGQRDRERT